MKYSMKILLMALARAVVKKYNPKIVAITGTVGKTSTKDAIALILESRFRVGKTMENYNNEIGVPLTILGARSAGKSILGWISILARALSMIFARAKKYPQILVLEYGADHRGDIARLCGIAQPDISIVTAVTPAHISNYENIEQIAEEKFSLVHCMKNGGLAVINIDDERVVLLPEKFSNVKMMTYGFAENANVRASDFELNLSADVSLTKFRVHANGDDTAIELSDAIGMNFCYSILAAAAVASHFGITLPEIATCARKFSSPPGRLKKIAGIKSSTIIDDTYNSSPASARAALAVLARFKIGEQAHRIAVLGDMLELGDFSEEQHKLIGRETARLGLDLLIAVGERARDIARGAREAGLAYEKIISFSDSAGAGRWLDEHVRAGDVVLIKGSQGMRMEKAVKDIMAEPINAPELLVRQYGKWISDY